MALPRSPLGRALVASSRLGLHEAEPSVSGQGAPWPFDQLTPSPSGPAEPSPSGPAEPSPSGPAETPQRNYASDETAARQSGATWHH